MHPSAHHATGSPHARPRLVCLFYSSRRRPSAMCSRLTARRGGGALARTRRLLPPSAGRAHARSHGRTSAKEPVPIRRRLLEPQRLSTSDTPKHASRDERLDRSAKDCITAHLRLWERVGWSGRTRAETVGAQSGAHHATGRPRARPTGAQLQLLVVDTYRTSATLNARVAVGRRSLMHAAASSTNRTGRTAHARERAPRMRSVPPLPRQFDVARFDAVLALLVVRGVARSARGGARRCSRPPPLGVWPSAAPRAVRRAVARRSGLRLRRRACSGCPPCRRPTNRSRLCAAREPARVASVGRSALCGEVGGAGGARVGSDMAHFFVFFSLQSSKRGFAGTVVRLGKVGRGDAREHAPVALPM